MAGLDTNILVRYLTKDDEIQSTIAQNLIENADNAPLFVPITVFLELEWVLRSRYKYSKLQIIEVMNDLLEIDTLKSGFENVLATAVWLYQISKADFADCLHTALIQAQNTLPMLTFDEDASKIADNQLLTANFP